MFDGIVVEKASPIVWGNGSDVMGVVQFLKCIHQSTPPPLHGILMPYQAMPNAGEVSFMEKKGKHNKNTKKIENHLVGVNLVAMGDVIVQWWC
jgi:hypothetical protein